MSVDVDEVLCHCFFAIGTGAKMPIKGDAIAALRNKYRSHFQGVFQDDSNAWNLEGHFVLEYCRAIGSLAAQKAVSQGATRIEEQDILVASVEVQDWVQNHTVKATRFCV